MILPSHAREPQAAISLPCRISVQAARDAADSLTLAITPGLCAVPCNVVGVWVDDGEVLLVCLRGRQQQGRITTLRAGFAGRESGPMRKSV